MATTLNTFKQKSSYNLVDATQAGGGKTHITIIPRTRQHLQMGIRTLIVVPGVALQEVYAKAFGTYSDIINSEVSHTSVVQQYAMSTSPVVCITSEAFKRIESFDKHNVELVIDEAIDPFQEISFNTHDTRGKRAVDLSDFINLVDPTLEELVLEEAKLEEYQPTFYEMKFDGQDRIDSIDEELWRALSAPHTRLWATPKQYVNIKGLSDQPSKVYLFSELKTDILDGWLGVWVAAAAFNHTSMCEWFKANDLDYTVVNKFKQHTSPVCFHMPKETATQDIFSWSKSYRAANPQVISQFKSYCEANREGRMLYNDSGDTVKFLNGDKINHNAHGLNQYSYITNYAFFSAIKPSNQFASFLTHRCGLGEDRAARISMMFVGYTVYQLLMRTSLRDPNNNTQVNAFFLDTEIVMGLYELFDAADIKWIDSINCNRTSKSLRKALNANKRATTKAPKKEPKKIMQKATKKAPLTSTQRSAKSRAKKLLTNAAKGK